MKSDRKLRFRPLTLIATLLITATLFSCNRTGEQASAIDYARLPELGLQEEVVISESEEFVAANLNGFFVAENGDLLITERSGPGIHQFTADGQYKDQIAREGRGPGEMSPWFSSHFNGSTLIATNNPGYNATIFQPDEEGLYQYVETVSHRYPGGFKGWRSEEYFEEFYASQNLALQRLRIPPEFTNSNIHIIEITEDSVTVTDSVFTLRTHSHFIEEFDGGGIRQTYLPYRRSDSFQALSDGRSLIARPDSQIIRMYDRDLQEEHVLNLNIKARSVTEEDLEFHIGHHNTSSQEKIRELIDEEKPAFLNVRLDDSKRFWLWTDDTEDGFEYVVLDYDGEPLGKILLPPGQRIEMISGDKLYVISEPEEDIPSAIVYSVSFQGD